jgi:hypothetical protein
VPLKTWGDTDCILENLGRTWERVVCPMAKNLQLSELGHELASGLESGRVFDCCRRQYSLYCLKR